MMQRAPICLLVTAVMMLATPLCVTAQPSLTTNGNKMRVNAQDLELNAPGAPGVVSLSNVVSQLSTVVSQFANMSTTVPQQLQSTSTRVDLLNMTLNTTQASLDAVNASAFNGIASIDADVTANRLLHDNLTGIVDQLSALVAQQATIAQLNALQSNLMAAIVSNSTALLQSMAECTARDPSAVFNATSQQCTVVRQQRTVFTCQSAATQRFTVPNGVTSMRIQAWGGGGAGSAWNTGGAGGYVEGTLAVSAGNQFTINVACSQPAGQFCFGTCGRFYQGAYPGATNNNFAGSGGGGYSGVFTGFVTPSQNNAVVVAGGGGGGGGGPQAVGSQQGGAGGGPSGQDGTVAHRTNAAPCDQGRGGTVTAGGQRGCRSNGGRNGMTNGGPLTGGVGDDGGGGGAGYFGGGGGSRGGSWIHGGGGGGSSFAASSLTQVVNAGYGSGGNFNVPPSAATSADNYISGVSAGGFGTVGGPGLVVITTISRVVV
eukprot:m.181746 g.181746  ORF g.181746 m.181746 type:complete len:486 (+) comp15349_c0_seq1:95-1552(+)